MRFFRLQLLIFLAIIVIVVIAAAFAVKTIFREIILL